MRVRHLLTAVLAATLALAACSAPASEPSTAIAQGVDPSFVHGTDRGPLDTLAATTVTDVQRFWSEQYPQVFDRPWNDLDGGFFSVDTTAPNGPTPPCAGDPTGLEGNAYYCAAVDAIAWDRSALLPVLQARYGDAAVVAVLAHEIGHAVQQRSGLDVGGADEPLLLETMADCYSGAYLHQVVAGDSPHLQLSEDDLDGAMRALLAFRDPVGTDSGTGDAHGTAYDRVTAFAEGHRHGAARCASFTEDRPFVGERLDAQPRPNVDLGAVLRSEDPRRFFGEIAGREAAPPIRTSTCASGQPVASCGTPTGVAIDREPLARLHTVIGDQATTTLLASRYAVAALDARNLPTTGREAGRTASCLTGAYVGARQETTGDVDEAVETLLVDDTVSRGSDNRSHLSGLDRLHSFRTGFENGPDACW
ncbi:peptidase [Allosaccharopolyspora coralli]|uniref:Peptidase n=1 Tax=Allosaccharopolyspora coralli TaxID=2665642 RepID=A0A5Q3Q9B1_9PSEU|nr:neutral zinc metallopeptidase [Allosaccharopolyspora coralli]QGK71138.1 peptidase [Allosaccharopolyspora coralli]